MTHCLELSVSLHVYNTHVGTCPTRILFPARKLFFCASVYWKLLSHSRRSPDVMKLVFNCTTGRF